MGGETACMRVMSCEIASVAFSAAGWPMLATFAFGAAMGLLVEKVVQCASHDGRVAEAEKGVTL